MIVIKLSSNALSSPHYLQRIAEIVKYFCKRYGRLIIVNSYIEKIADYVNSIITKSGEYGSLGTTIKLIRDTINDYYISQIKPSEKIVHELLKNLEDKLRAYEYIGESFPKYNMMLYYYIYLISNHLLYDMLISTGINISIVNSEDIIISSDDPSNPEINIEGTTNNLENLLSAENVSFMFSGGIAKNTSGNIAVLNEKEIDKVAALASSIANANHLLVLNDDKYNKILFDEILKTKGQTRIFNYDEAIDYFSITENIFSRDAIHILKNNNTPIRFSGVENFSRASLEVANPDKNYEDSSLKAIFLRSNLSHIRIFSRKVDQIPDPFNIDNIINKISGGEIYWLNNKSQEGYLDIILPIDQKNKFLINILSDEENSRFSFDIKDNISLIGIIADMQKYWDKILNYTTRELSKNNIVIKDIIKNISSNLILFIIDSTNEKKALKIAQNLQLMENGKIVNLFIVGTGKVGSSLFHILKSRSFRKDVNLRIVGITNTRKMLIDERGIDLHIWEENLINKGKKANIEEFKKEIINNTLPNKVFIDCTPSKDIAFLYPELIRNGVSVVTANKIMNTESYQLYEQLRDNTRNGYVRYLYETTVGAGLPIISSIRSLVDSGDKVLKIEALLSGTMSFIMNNVNKGIKLSEAVYKAWMHGYTEPDIRNDLDGMDTKRKLLILIRESGAKMELSDIELKPLIPEEYFNVKSNEELIEKLKNYDDEFAGIINTAKKRGKKLMYLAYYDSKEAKVGLREVDKNSPFYHLEGNDNLVVIQTSRYYTNPLVVRGPGAGPEITAGSIIKDVMKLVDILEF